MTKKLRLTITFLLKPPMMKRRSQQSRRVNRKVKKVMKNTSNFQESNCSKLLMNVVMKQTTSTWKFRTREINRTPIGVQTKNCYLCLEEINGQPDYKANKDKLNNKVKTVCISCKNTTCIKHLITTCERCFEGSGE